MQEKLDGSFDKIRPFCDIFEKLRDPGYLKQTRAIHFGTIEELEAVKAKKQEGWIEDKLDELSERLGALEEKEDRPSVIWRPTRREVQGILARCKK
jgi:hypothetical protein